MKRHLLAIGAVSALAFVPVAAAPAAPLTTNPQQVITVKVTITDTGIRMIPKSAPRGVLARFILTNHGIKPHSFSLGHLHRQTGYQTGFVASLKPAEQAIKILFLDYRGLLPYLGTLPADRARPAMKGTFKVF